MVVVVVVVVVVGCLKLSYGDEMKKHFNFSPKNRSWRECQFFSEKSFLEGMSIFSTEGSCGRNHIIL